MLPLLLSLVVACPQVRYPARPAEREFILDEGKIIKPEDAAEIQRTCDQVLTEKKVPIKVLTITKLADYGAEGWPFERYAMNVMAEWGIGWREWNYGILLLVSPGDRKMRIELGGSWGHKKDAEADRIRDQRLLPHFKKGDYSAGIREGVKGLAAMARGVSAPPGDGGATGIRDRLPGIGGCGGGMTWIIVILGVLFLLSLFRRRRTRAWGPGMGTGGGGMGSGCGGFGSGCLGAMVGNMLFGGLGGGRRSGLGGGGGGRWGGGSYGGGFSGGGGSTGSW